MNLTTLSPNLRSAGLKLSRWELSPEAPSTSPSAGMTLESLSLSAAATTKMSTAGQRLGQLSRLSAGLTGAKVDRTANHATSGSQQGPDLSVRERALAAVRQRELEGYAHVETALTSGQPTAFRNSAGQDVSYTLQHNKNAGEHASYTLGMGQHKIEVQLPEGEDRVLGLGRIADFTSQQPEKLRGAVDTVRVELGDNPSNAHWEKEYGRPGFESAATGGGGTITFYQGLSHLKQNTFHHEYGHNIGESVRHAQDREAKVLGTSGAVGNLDRETGDARGTGFPRGYSQALAADNRQVSSYGDASTGEDFAEFYAAHRTAANQGEAQLKEFTEQYPNRSRLLQTEVFSRELSTAK